MNIFKLETQYLISSKYSQQDVHYLFSIFRFDDE